VTSSIFPPGSKALDEYVFGALKAGASGFLPKDIPPAGHTLEGLTDRELEVLALVARGLPNAEIAQHLYVSPATAKTHVARLLMKLGARDRAQLIVVAYESGLVTPGPRPS
jgi:DNA-binding NarL/FixJ family response regulator